MKFDFPQKHSHELVLFFYPSPGLNWSNPKGLTFTAAFNKLIGRPRSIGHVSVLVRSGDQFFLTGMTQENKDEGQREVFFEGYGLGILVHNFKGALEKQDDLIPELCKRAKKPGWLSFLRIQTNEKINERLHEYFETYQKNKYYHSYGMNNRPLHGEGAGCSAFAASFLETAGVLEKEFEREWTRQFRVPANLMGGPKLGKKVSIIDILLKANRWADEHEPHEKAFFWDPDLMHGWIMRNHDREIRRPTGDFQVDQWEKSSGLIMDARGLTPPSGKIFKHE